MPFDYGLRLHNRQRLANARAKPIEANKNQSVDGAEGLFLRSGSPQNVYLLPQHPNFRLERCPRPKQICDHPNNEPDKISHHATASPDSRSTASQIEFAIGTGGKNRLSNISKQGDRYLRGLFVAGALSVIRYAKIHGTKHRPWLTALLDQGCGYCACQQARANGLGP
jgi:hypothetical protein